MWKEIDINETDEELEKLADFNNQFSCWRDPKVIVTDSKEIFKRQLSGTKYPYRCFVYKDSKFEMIKDYRFRTDMDMWQLMRFGIKWDTNDPSIDPFDAIKISALQTKTFLQEIGKKIFIKPLAFDEVDDLISNWYKPEIVDVFLNIGINLFYQDNGKYWEWELL